jgi:phenylalanyl-tRNA synthetase beta chain
MEIRRILTGLGLNEAQGQTLISRSSIHEVPAGEILDLANPLSRDMDALRPSLLPGLLEILAHNARHQNRDVALFEIGRVFRASRGTSRETWKIGIALTGLRNPGFWKGADREARYDAHDLKGIIEETAEHAGLRGLTFTRRAEQGALFAESAVVAIGGRVVLGEIGQVDPRVAHRSGIRDAVFVGEIDLDQFLARRGTARAFKALPVFPSVRRDVAMIVAETVTHAVIAQAVRSARAPNLETIELFDVFRGQQVGPGEKSMAYAFTYRAADRTLTDAEVNAAHSRIVEQLKSGVGAKIRE